MSISLIHGWSMMRARLQHSRILHPKTREDRNEVLFYLNTGVFGFATGGIMAFLPVFLARLGASSTMLGWLNAAPALWLLPAAVVWGITAPGVDLGLFDLMLASCAEERLPLFGAVWSMVASLAMFVGPLIGARLGEGLGLTTALMVVAGLQVLATAPFAALPNEG